MSAQQRVLDLLRSQVGEWVTRAQIVEAGGPEGPRRVRELHAAGWPIESMERPGGWWYRLADNTTGHAISGYRCTHCGDEKPLKSGYIPIDPRFAIVSCKGRDQPARRIEP